MERVTGIGGIFFKSPDPKALTAWYQQHLGITPMWDTEPGIDEDKARRNTRPSSGILMIAT